jgi:hypothetical protein
MSSAKQIPDPKSEVICVFAGDILKAVHGAHHPHPPVRGHLGVSYLKNQTVFQNPSPLSSRAEKYL